MREVVVGIDPDQAEAVLVRAVAEARTSGRALRVARVCANGEVADPRQPPVGLGCEQLDRAMESARTLCGGPARVEVTGEVLTGETGPALLASAADAGLLVVGTGGVGTVRAALFGSVAYYVVHDGATPVMVVPERAAADTAVTRVVVGVDGSPESRASLRWAADAARRHDCPLLVLRAWLLSNVPGADCASLRGMEADCLHWLEAELARVLPDPPERLQLAVPHAGAAGALLEAAQPTDLLVLGSRGQGGFEDLVLGSTAAQVAPHARCPVVLVRDGEARLDEQPH